jgi:hypothetical protein
MGKDNWLPLCYRVKISEKECWETYGTMDEVVGQIIINLAWRNCNCKSNSEAEEVDLE